MQGRIIIRPATSPAQRAAKRKNGLRPAMDSPAPGETPTPRHSGLDPESSSSIKFLRRFAPEKTILDSGLSQQ
jgi:hypothetical protein